MNSRALTLAALAALLAGSAGWYVGRRTPASPGDSVAQASAAGTSRKILFYQSAMHPWIKSEKPGKCTICGMDLTPVFEGDAAMPLDPGLVSLASNAISVLHVRTSPVRKGALVRSLRVAGVLGDDDTRRRVLSAWVAGRVDHLDVNYVGSEVRPGQPLARFFSPMLLEAERQYLAVHASTGTGSLPPDQALLRDAATLRLRQLGLADSQIEALPTKSPTNIFSEILAPVGGTVVARFVYPGQYVMEGEKLFEIADLSTLWFLFDAYEQDLPFLSPGQEVEITSPTAPGHVVRAPIRFVDPNLADMTRSAKVRVEVTNPIVSETPQTRRALLHRGYAEGRVRIEVPDVLLVSRSAVLSPDDRPVVYVDRGGGVYEQRSVRLGRFGDAEYEVLEGLAADEPVVVQGNLLIDAQAQLNRTVHAAGASSGGSDISHDAHAAHRDGSSGAPPIPDALVRELRAFLETADALRVALAADDLARFETSVREIAPAIDRIRASLSSAPETKALASLLPALPTSASFADLRSARKAFHGFVAAELKLFREVRNRAAGIRDLKIYRCPMTAEAFDGAPPRAEWLQLAPPLRNPWFGAEMLECGVEVRD